MTMRTRRVSAERMDRLFITTEIALTLAAGNISSASQQITNQIGSDFVTRTGRNLHHATVGRVWINGLWFTLAVVTTPVVIGLSMGLMVVQTSLDAGDFPALAIHQGDWFMHRTWRLTDRFSQTTDPTPLDPSEPGVNSGSIAIDNKSKRKIKNVSETVFLVIQKDVVTEENIQLHVDVTTMWLI